MLNYQKRKSEQTGLPISKVIFTSLMGLLLTAGLTFLAAILLHREILPLTVCGWLGPVILTLSSLLSTWLAVRRNGKKLLYGLLSAGIYGLALMICGMLLFSTPMQPGRMALSAGALLLGMLGGVVLSALGE